MKNKQNYEFEKAWWKIVLLNELQEIGDATNAAWKCVPDSPGGKMAT